MCPTRQLDHLVPDSNQDRNKKSWTLCNSSLRLEKRPFKTVREGDTLHITSQKTIINKHFNLRPELRQCKSACENGTLPTASNKTNNHYTVSNKTRIINHKLSLALTKAMQKCMSRWFIAYSFKEDQNHYSAAICGLNNGHAKVHVKMGHYFKGNQID